MAKGSLSSNRGKSRRKQRTTNRPATTLSPKQRVAPSKVIPPTPIPSYTAPAAQQIAPQSHVFSDLKRIGIITGAMLIILIILYLVL